MSMSTHVVGFKPPDEKWKMMKAAYDACTAAGIPVPDDLCEFFGDNPPDDEGVKVDEDKLKQCGAVRKWAAKMRDGFEVDITKLPRDVKVVRFFNSY